MINKVTIHLNYYRGRERKKKNSSFFLDLNLFQEIS